MKTKFSDMVQARQLRRTDVPHACATNVSLDPALPTEQQGKQGHTPFNSEDLTPTLGSSSPAR